MAQSQARLIPEEENPPSRHGRHRLDMLDATRVAKQLIMFEPSEQVIGDLVAEACKSIPGLASAEEAIRVQRFNPMCVMAVARKSRFDPKKAAGEGFIAVLPLNTLGLQSLALGTFDGASPDLRLLAHPGERPAGIYMWGVFAPGPLAAGMALFMEKMAPAQYAGVNLYSRPNTEVGRRFNEVLGFKKGTSVGSIVAPNVWIFRRQPEPPLYDTYVPGAHKKEVGITVARTFDDLMKVAAIRNAVYIGEQECPYDEEYDGNDLSSTHLLAYMGDEPIGCLRVRFFADFAKFERMAIRKEFRKSRAAILLAQAAIKLARRKGYLRGYAHSQARLVDFWGRFGFRPLEGAKPFVFSDYDYVEIVADFPADPDAVRIGTSPYVVIRPEGRWHEQGILESSAGRPATNPSVAKKG